MSRVLSLLRQNTTNLYNYFHKSSYNEAGGNNYEVR
nr:MAG TPA: hypothetical protein [Caudoviricetes sp.]